MTLAHLRLANSGIWITLTLSVAVHGMALAYLSGGSSDTPSTPGARSMQVSLTKAPSIPPATARTLPLPPAKVTEPLRKRAAAQPLLSLNQSARTLTASPAHGKQDPPVQPTAVRQAVAKHPATPDSPPTPSIVAARPAAPAGFSAQAARVTEPAPPETLAPELDPAPPREGSTTTATGLAGSALPARLPHNGTADRLSSLKQTLVSRLHQALASHFSYPVKARRRHWEGEVLLRVQIQSDGQISNAEVDQSSGYRLLDQAAINSLMRVERVPGIQPESAIELLLPVRYRLQG